jgi:mannose-6-phosphate isomerase-like protein (cupin superfamily)
MSYPEARYLGDGGEASATVRLGSASPELDRKSTATSYLATGETTHGMFGLYRWNFKGPRSGPDPHFHRSISESFYILSGTVRIYDGRRWIDTTPGDFVHVPEGGVHAFRNESGEPASMLLHFAPGGPREVYFEGLLTLADKSEEEKAEFYREHDTYWL